MEFGPPQDRGSNACSSPVKRPKSKVSSKKCATYRSIPLLKKMGGCWGCPLESMKRFAPPRRLAGVRRCKQRRVDLEWLGLPAQPLQKIRERQRPRAEGRIKGPKKIPRSKSFANSCSPISRCVHGVITALNRRLKRMTVKTRLSQNDPNAASTVCEGYCFLGGVLKCQRETL